MPTYTNMAWPDDPYGTGQLWRQEPPLLAGFAVLWAGDSEEAAPVSYAVAYLRLHRTQAVDLTQGVTFGFRATAAVSSDQREELVSLFDLDALRARRLAKIVAGCFLARDLCGMGALAVGETGRGIRGLAAAWGCSEGSSSPGLARTFDVADENTPCGGDLLKASADIGIAPSAALRAFEQQKAIGATADIAGEQASSENLPAGEQDSVRSAERLAACSTERALICAIIAGRMLGRHTWNGLLNTGEAMAANAWDCYPAQDFDQPVPK